MIISWEKFDRDCQRLAVLIKEHSFYNRDCTYFYAIPKGGFFVAARVAYALGMHKDRFRIFTDSIVLGQFDFVIDDIFDTGKTWEQICFKYGGAFAALYAKERVTSIPSGVLISRQLKTMDHIWMPWGD